MSYRNDQIPDRLRPEGNADEQQSIHSSPTLISSPVSPFYNRFAYRRLSTPQEEEQEYQGDESPPNLRPQPSISELPEDDSVHGLRIRFSDHDEEALKVGATIVEGPIPQAKRSLSASIRSPSSGLNRYDSYEDGLSSYGRSSQASMHRLDAPFSADTEEELLHVKRSMSTIKSFDTSKLQSNEPRCKTRRSFHHSRGTWLSVTILILSVYSTIFSGIWLAIAIARPRYGKLVTNTGSLPPASASLLCAAFAKTIELSFVTVFVTFLGQVLSQRAFVKQSRGITIAEMQMRSWVMQPGTMITHGGTVRYAALSFLGVVALTAAMVATLYTTASDGLVAPKLKFGKMEDRTMYGKVETRFGYHTYLETNCNTPITNATDPYTNGQTCMAITYSGQSYHNYGQWMNKWSESTKEKNGTLDQAKRPPPLGMLYDNTTIEGSWIGVQDITQTSRHFGRIVNNVTMAMPHTAVLGAARDSINGILQPQDLDGLGEYYLEASVPSPATNVLCAQMTQEDLTPMVLTLWDRHGNTTLPNNTNWPDGWDILKYPSYLNTTKVDDLFGFGKKYNRRMPVFPKLPLPYNTVLNNTAVTDFVSTDSLYVLATSKGGEYMMCSLRTYLSPNCSTVYHASLTGGTLNTRCNDPSNQMAYYHSHPEAASENYNTSENYDSDWINVANQWASAISLGAGLSDDYASNARLLTQLIPNQDALAPDLPTIAEALAVLAGSTLILGGIASPLIHRWNYSSQYLLDPPQYQAFNATLRSQDFSSGGTQKWQGIFYLVLLLVFVTNLFCLVYFFLHKGLVTDFIEPQNLFALALNSPQSHVIEGSCGGGPEGKQLATNWHIRLDAARDHFFIESLDDPVQIPRPPSREPHSVRRRPWQRRGRAFSEGTGVGGVTKSKNSGGLRSKTRIFQRGSSGGSGDGEDGTNELMTARQRKQMQLEHSPIAELFQRFSRKRASIL